MDKDDVISTLNDLIETCKDGEYGYRASAEHLHNAQTRMRFTQAADQCSLAGSRLSAEVVRLGGKAEEGGSVAGALHRGWVAVRSTLGMRGSSAPRRRRTALTAVFMRNSAPYRLEPIMASSGEQRTTLSNWSPCSV